MEKKQNQILIIQALCIGLTMLFTNCQPGQKSTSVHTGSNHLVNETSPYLLQHAHNPVDWYPWNDEVLKMVKEKRKLMIISIGYSSCHWCHVMERESFSDTAVSNFMNRHFVSIKVDREERPDVDQVYMNACQIANANGMCGWPLNVLAMSDGRPFWVGTYLTRDQWMGLLKEFVELYHEDPNELEKMANNIHNHLAVDYSRFATSQDTQFSQKTYKDRINQMFSQMDLVYGGKKANIKFPLPSLHRTLFDNQLVFNDLMAQKYLPNYLDKLMYGGINDALDGGFARYSTDPFWKVPHFEKMLYDNAQLISLYSQAYQVSGQNRYREVVEKTVDFVNRNLSNPSGYFYSSLDADSDGEEGKYYVFTQSEINNAIKDPSHRALFTLAYNITSSGNWEKGLNVLYRTTSDDELASKLKLPIEDIKPNLQKAGEELLQYRSIRKSPGLDDKMLTAWNALMIRALADASAALQRPDYLKQAITAASFMRKNILKQDHSLFRTFKGSKASVNGFLEDYALTIDAWIRLYELTFDESYLQEANQMCQYVISNFSSTDNLFFYFNSSQDKQLITRSVDFEDQVIPCANSVMADVLHRLGLYFYNSSYVNRSKGMVINVMEHFISRNPEYYNNWLRIYGSFLRPPYEVAIVGPKALDLRDEWVKRCTPQCILLGGTTEGTLELLKDKLQGDRTVIYVCRNKVCKLPVTEVSKAYNLLN